MANTKKYVSLDKLGLYDEKIKGVISAGDSKALEDAKKYADGLAANYDAAGSAATALADAKAYADGKNSLIAEAKQAGVDAAAAAKVADDKAVAAQGEVDALETYVGTFSHQTAKSVVEYIDAKTSGIASADNLNALDGRVGIVEGKVATIEGDYLKAADKTGLENLIAGVQSAVDTEKSRAEGIEAGLRTDVDAIKADYLKAADKTELQGNINTVSAAVERLTNGVSATEIDGVNDLINYVNNHGATVTGLQDGIAQNTADIAGVAGRMTTAEGKISALEGSVATKVEQSDFDTAVSALQGVDTGLGNRISAIEAKFGDGEGNVESQIAAAKDAAIAAAALDATSKANAAEGAAKTYADGLDSAMNTRVAALEAIDHSHTFVEAELNKIADGDVAKWNEAYTKRHEHSNLSVLEAITALKVAAWDGAEVNAKTYADSLNSAMNTRVTTLETWHNNFTEVSEDEINQLFA